jgi:hypothetical protein
MAAAALVPYQYTISEGGQDPVEYLRHGLDLIINLIECSLGEPSGAAGMGDARCRPTGSSSGRRIGKFEEGEGKHFCCPSGSDFPAFQSAAGTTRRFHRQIPLGVSI